MPELEGVSHSFHEVRGVRLHVAEAGEGEPLVLLHGWPQNWWCWRRMIPALAESGFRVIAPDMRGYGWSERVRDGFEKEELARDLVALLDVLGLERVQLIGHDWGGWVGFMACLAEPGRIERFMALSIMHPFPKMDLGQVLGVWKLAYQVPLAAPLVGRTLGGLSGLAPFMIRSGTTRADAFGERDYEIYSKTCDPHTTVGTYRTSLTHDIPRAMLGRHRRRLSVPTRLVIGENEPLAGPEGLRGYEEHADDMAIEVIPGAGHFLPEEAPDELVRLARSFLRPARRSAAPAT